MTKEGIGTIGLNKFHDGSYIYSLIQRGVLGVLELYTPLL